MISVDEFIKQSLALHLFFARIMQEHSFFLQTAFTAKDYNLTNQADSFRRAFDNLLANVVEVSNGVVNPDVLKSGEVVTPYTLKAEMASAYFTGVPLQTDLTQAEMGMTGGEAGNNSVLEQRVYYLNENAINLVSSLIQFKSLVLSNVISCNLFTMNYPLLIDHILREARLYLSMLQKLQRREEVSLEKEAYEQETFWNRIMAEHSKFIRGLLDPTEKNLFETADNFGNEFDQLTAQAQQAMDRSMPMKTVTEDSLEATKKIQNFKTAGTQGILECKIKSIIIPLLGDHTLREANHYLRLLEMFNKIV
ncbi:DUF2935 domain-containing protein [Caproiciproducens galactitolivorans]|uniref:DUF2935 domain-containing protein n=1 Tax=Caproiciproducens galactitolivorans TaxID=642589 RepID=A0ABT4BU84_9FIRM|nr:DUF2935 domain-containing protein [Caproiciproducens galactitolivorans]MCY1714455.1 DUF2935 domain-containing protein [Caproiciproducens galactitolivorans]